MGCAASQGSAPTGAPTRRPSVIEWEWDNTRKMNYRTAADAKPRWTPFHDSQCRILESAYSAGQSSVELALDVAKGHGLRKTGEAEQTYHVDLQHFLQVNRVTGFVRRVRRRETQEDPESSTAIWQEYPSVVGTVVFIGGLQLHTTKDDVVKLFEEEPPDHCTLEAVHGEAWQDGTQTGRRRYCVVSWNRVLQAETLADVAARAEQRLVIVILHTETQTV